MTSAKTVFFNEIYTPIHLINFLFLVFFLQDEYYLPDLSETQEQKISGNDPMNAWGFSLRNYRQTFNRLVLIGKVHLAKLLINIFVSNQNISFATNVQTKQLLY